MINRVDCAHLRWMDVVQFEIGSCCWDMGLVLSKKSSNDNDMELYPYQKLVANHLERGSSVVLQAPTGIGKTFAALWPFIHQWMVGADQAFPRQCIYIVPMRVLANQFVETTRQLITNYIPVGNRPTVAIQTGARPEDRHFDADIVFTTFDQALSSFLTVPYSLGNRQANLNAGAVIGSYLVFDEFHLFPVDSSGNGALATTLQMLHMLKGVTPFVLMTATLSRRMVEHLAPLLGAEAVTLTAPEISSIPSQQNKRRSYRFCQEAMSVDSIISDLQIHHRHRVIVICNTVDRAQSLTMALQSDERISGMSIELLHSRFYTSDRNRKETRIRREFGEDRALATQGPMILVATQVIEVGLNISCDVLHTDLAPAASIIQRAGRCARFAQESGDVYIYELPLNEQGGFDYAPYIDEQQQICERTREALHTHIPHDGQLLSYHDELALVDTAHDAHDQQLVTILQDRHYLLGQRIEQIMLTQQRNLAPELIRDIDTRTVFIHENPTEQTVPHPYRYESIGLRPHQLQRWFKAVNSHAWDQGLDWIAKIAHSQEDTDTAESAEQRRLITTRWQSLAPGIDGAHVNACISDLWSSGYLVTLHPALVHYNAELGLLLHPGSTTTGESPFSESMRTREEYGPIAHESYESHIAGLYQVYTRTYRKRTAAVRNRLEQHFGLDQDQLDRAIRLMFAVHDLGKLDQEWQSWAHSWQARVVQLRQQPELAFPPDFMAAHTDYDARDERERRSQSAIRPKRPNHAAESARAARDLINAIALGHESLCVALMGAIICHHTPHFRTDHGPFRPHVRAKPAFYRAMQVVDLFEDQTLRSSGARIDWKGFSKSDSLSEYKIDFSNRSDLLFYLLLVRILRLCDQQSQDRA